MRVPDQIKSLLLTAAPLYRLVPTPLWKRIKDCVFGYDQGGYPDGKYWAARQDMAYYERVKALIGKHSAGMKSILDVGANDTDVISGFEWLTDKTVIDIAQQPKVADAECIKGDFFTHDFGKTFDVVTCLQVMEHVGDPEEFAKKLLSLGSVVVVSVPYKWPSGAVDEHIQDPVNKGKILGWFGKKWIEHTIVFDQWDRRLIAVFEGDQA